MDTVGNLKNVMGLQDLEMRVARVHIGLTYTAVQLNDGGTGVAYSFPRQACDLGAPDDARPLAGRSARELIGHLGGNDLTASAVALSTINAVVSRGASGESVQEGDVLEVLDIRQGDRLCMVGCFLPVVKRLETRGVEVVTLDQKPKPGSLPAEEVSKFLPQSQVAIVTATAIINGTIDPLLDLASACREVAILGPSTPLVPAAFRGSPVTCLAGVLVEEPEGVFQVVAEGGGFRRFRKYTRKVTLRLK